MKSSFLNRIYRAIKIDPNLYEEVEHDKSATIQAASVVILSSLAAGIGAIHLGFPNDRCDLLLPLFVVLVVLLLASSCSSFFEVVVSFLLEHLRVDFELRR